MITKNCLVCNSLETSSKIKIKDHLVSKDFFEIASCKSCGFRYISNPPSEDEVARYYDTEEYIEHSDTSDGLINMIYHRVRAYMIKKKHNLLLRENRPKKILDIGTGTGYFLQYMKKMGFESYGLEINDKARAFGRDNFNLDIRSPQAIFDSGFEKGFGYITFWHVLEHIYDPEKTLLKLKGLLHKNGIAVIALPNHKCLDQKYYKENWCAYDVPRHLWHFDKGTFIKFADKVGFDVYKTSMLPFDPFYNSLISETYKKNKLSYLFMPFVAFFSLIIGMFDHSKASSIVYYLKKR